MKRGIEFSNLEELAEALQPENNAGQTNQFLLEHVISKTNQHLSAKDMHILRRNAKRIMKNRKENNTSAKPIPAIQTAIIAEPAKYSMGKLLRLRM